MVRRRESRRGRHVVKQADATSRDPVLAANAEYWSTGSRLLRAIRRYDGPVSLVDLFAIIGVPTWSDSVGGLEYGAAVASLSRLVKGGKVTKRGSGTTDTVYWIPKRGIFRRHQRARVVAGAYPTLTRAVALL